jgi:purine-cytosine permease-like protein
MGKIILIIACALLVLTIAAGFLVPKMSEIIGPILIADIIILAVGVLMIAKETRPQRF